jgi:hypothetical protein
MSSELPRKMCSVKLHGRLCNAGSKEWILVWHHLFLFITVEFRLSCLYFALVTCASGEAQSIVNDCFALSILQW